MPQQRQHWFEGWRLFFVLTLVLAGLCTWIAGMRQFEVEGVRLVIRFTARASLGPGLAMRPLKSRLTFDVNAMTLKDRPPTALGTAFLKSLARTIDALSRPA